MLARWQHYWPDAEYIIESDDGIDPFNKSMAVNNAAAKATGDIYVVLDADAWIQPDWMERGIAALTSGKANWTRPARHMRFKQGFSERLLALPPTTVLPPLSNRTHAESYGGVVGFIWVITAKAWWDMAWHDSQGTARGMDERIRGWGGEDSAFTMAAKAIIGGPRHLGGTVVCLWHDRPRQNSQRVWVGQDRTLEQDKNQLVAQYKRAIYRESAMREVLCQS